MLQMILQRVLVIYLKSEALETVAKAVTMIADKIGNFIKVSEKDLKSNST